MSFNPENMVRDFIDAFGASRDPLLWEKLIEEESKEVVEAFYHLMKELSDLMYVCHGYSIVSGEDEEIDPTPTQLDALFILDLLEGIPMPMRQEAFLRVHESNMSKLGEDGKPVKREDGKVLKGPNYKPADMSGLLYYHI